MKCINLCKALNAAALIGATLLGANALADPPQQNDGMGPGMMGDSGSSDYGMGPGMIRGWGHGYGMGPGMMGDWGRWSELTLTAEQRRQIAKIQDDLRRKHWALMGKMLDVQSQMNDQQEADEPDDAALSKSFRNMSDLRQQMFDLSLAARKQINAVLTKEQREKLKSGGYQMWQH